MARIHVFDYVENRRTGIPMEGVVVSARYKGTDTIAPIYQDEGGTVFNPPNQVTTDADGNYSFYIEQGQYSLYFSVGSEPIKIIEDFTPGLTGPAGPANSTYETTALLEMALTSNVSAILAEAGKAGTFTTRDYADFTAQVAADPGKINYIRSVLSPDKVWVRTSILSDAAAQTGASSGLTVDAELAAKATLIGTSRTATTLGTINTSLVDDNLTVKQAFESAGDNLFAPAGAALIGYSAGSGATARTAQDKLRDFVNVSDFGAVGNGVADDTAAFADAADFLVTRSNGGRILCSARYKIGSTLSLPDGVSIESVGACHGTLYPSSDGNRGATLIIASTATILLNNGSGLTGLFIKRDGLTYGITSAEVASTFQGTAITLATNRGDQVLEDLYIMGFDTAIKSQDTTTVGSDAQNNRVRIFNVAMDCVNGIWLHNSYDVSYIDRVHCWPYVTVGSVAEAGDAQLKRSGAAIKLTGKNDWTKVYNSFSFGYGVGSQVTDGHSVTFLNVSHDHPPGSTDGSKGYYFDGDASEIRVIGGQVAGKQYGAHVNCTTSSGRLAVTFSSTNIWVTTTQSLRIQVGSVQVIGGSLRNDPTSPNGIGIKNENTGTAEVSILGVDFAGLATGIENQASTSILRHRHCTFRNVNTQITNAYVPSMASAATLVPNGVDEVIILTGTTNIGTISSPQRYTGRRLTLQATAALTVLVGGNIRLKDNVNFIMAAGDTLTLMSDGTNWYEVSRTQVNAWVTSFVPTISATSGAITTSSATCQYRKDGANVVFSMNITITTNGTGAGTLRATLPASAASSSIDAVFVGRDRGVGGKSITATLIAGGNTIDIKNYDNTYPAADGSVIVISGTYRVA